MHRIQDREYTMITLDDLQQAYQIDPTIIRIWATRESDTLLPIQAAAIREHHILEGRDLLVSAPTSSGKTFLAEIAAIHTIYQRKKVVYLLPLKALAEEKYADFSEKYTDFGLDVVISTGDRTEFDHDIERGDFQLAILVFEKANRLLVKNKHFLDNCGLIIVDEIQMTADFSRGSSLEMLLTAIRHSRRDAHPLRSRPQLIALSAVLTDLNRLDTWLGLETLRSAQRPVELQEGIVSRDGTFTYRSFLSNTVGREQLPPLPAHLTFNLKSAEGRREYAYRRLQHYVAYFLAQGEQVLVFRKWKWLTRETALHLSRDLNLPPALETLEVVYQMEDSISKEMLIKALRHGAAFHNADLGRDERRIIEHSFRAADSKIRVICATSTLAMGINLPVKTVIINDLEKPDPNAAVFQEIPISSADYKNMSGRAGRLKRQDQGRSIIFADTPAQEQILWRNYIEGPFPQMQSLLPAQSLHEETLFLVAAGLCTSLADLEDFMLQSYAGALHWREDAEAAADMYAKLEAALAFCLEHDLLAQTTTGALQATEIGRICAAQGVSVESFVTLTRFFAQLDPAACHPWELLFVVTHNRELEDLHFRLSQIAFESGEYRQAVEELNPGNWEPLVQHSEAIFQSRFEVVKRLKMAFLLLDWMRGVSVQQLELKYSHFYRDKSYSGVIRGLAENAGWMLRLLAEVTAIRHEDQTTVHRLHTLARMILYGVPETGIELAALHVPGLTRAMITRLAEAGYTREEHVLDAAFEDLSRIIPHDIAFRLQDTVYHKYNRVETRHLADQKLRLERLGYDSAILQQVYTASDLDTFGAALHQIFRSPQVNLVLRQAREAAADRSAGRDYLLEQQRGTFVIRILPPDVRDLSEEQLGSLLTVGLQAAPAGFLLIGRPDFSEAAYACARQFAATYSKPISLIPAYAICERYVQALEGAQPASLFDV